MATNIFTVNDVGNPEPVIVDTVCSEVIVGEDPSAAGYGRSFKVRGALTETPMQVDPKLRYAFKSGNFYKPGDIAGYCETVSGAGSTSFQKDEH